MLIRSVAGLDTPQAFLQSIARGMDTKVSPESWDELFKLESAKLKADGVDVSDRRYVKAVRRMECEVAE